MKTPSGLRIDDATWPLLRTHISYWGTSDAPGLANGTTIVCGALVNEPSYAGHQVKLLTGAAAGQSSRIDTQVGNTLTVPHAFTDAAGAPWQVVAGTAFVILTDSWGLDIAALIVLMMEALSPSRFLLETWQDVLGINPNIWTVVSPAIPWAAPTEAGGFLYAQTTLVANEVARLRSVQQWVEYPNTPSLNLIVKKTILEWEMMLGVPANLDNAICIWGFTNGPNDNRGSNDLIGFGLTGGILQAVVDLGGGESEVAVPAAVLTNHNKFRIEIYEGTVDWYFNEVLVRTAVAGIPVVPMYIQQYFDTTNAGGCVIDIGIVRCWFEMVVA